MWASLAVLFYIVEINVLLANASDKLTWKSRRKEKLKQKEKKKEREEID